MQNYVRIFDTTLRDGEQSPGATMTSSEKLEVARALSRIGVDVIETGFPAASRDDLDAVRQIARRIGAVAVDGRQSSEPPVICALARAKPEDINRAWEGVRDACRPRIHCFLATSPVHREHKLRMSREQVIERIRSMVAYTRELCEDVEFSPEDAGRTEPEFLYEAVQAAIDAGASTVNIPDTVGYTTPQEFGALIAGIRTHVADVDRAVISVHCHDDLGMATANTLAGIANGARQAEVTINGIGERAGNTALEEVVMAIVTRHRLFGLTTGIDTSQIAWVSKLVSRITGIAVQPNKAIVGANAFAHESGIHQDGMLKHHETYEIMRPESVGIDQTRLVLGKHSGRHALGQRLGDLGYVLDSVQLAEVFERFKALADRKKCITNRDIEALVADEFARSDANDYVIESLQIVCGTMGLSTATVRLRGPDGEDLVSAGVAPGPLDACCRAIDAAIGVEADVLEYNVNAVTPGTDALGEVSVRVGFRDSPDRHSSASARPSVFHGHGVDTDVVVASAKAYVAALNRLIAAEGSHRTTTAKAG